MTQDKDFVCGRMGDIKIISNSAIPPNTMVVSPELYAQLIDSNWLKNALNVAQLKADIISEMLEKNDD